MIIDFNDIKDEVIEGFKGGKGILLMRSYMDKDCKIMRHVLKSGASSGLHVHDKSCEIINVLKGEITVCCDGITEHLYTGQVHYCPCGHSHYIENNTDKDVEYLAIVAELSN